MRFEWDDKKNVDNIKKHKISFAKALHAFFDPKGREYYDDKHSTPKESRMIFAGFAENRPLIISFTEPDDETIRIISARKATKHDLEVLYYGNG